MLEALLGFVGSIVVEVLLIGLFYWPGWLIARVITFGRYPPARGAPHNEIFVATIGLATILATVTTVYFVL
jgi:hypothetical protein